MAESGEVDFDETAQEEQDEADDQAEQQEDEAEVYLADAQTSESEMESDGMLDWGPQVCKDYKDGAFATVARASPPTSQETLGGGWEWRGRCLVRVHRQFHRCLYTPTWNESLWQGLTVQPQKTTHVKPKDQSSRSQVIENVKSVDPLRPRKVAYPWTGETHFKVAPDAQSKTVFCTSARI